MVAPKEKEFFLSASTIDSVNTCAWKWYVQKKLKIPDLFNEATARGSLVHSILEALSHVRHKPNVARILEGGHIFSDIAVRNLTVRLAKKHEIELDKYVVNAKKTKMVSNIDLINSMILLALKCDFFGDNPTEIIREKEYRIEKYDVEGEVLFRIRGFIDIQYFYKGENSKLNRMKIRDYKTSKLKFDANKMEGNIQGFVYTMFVIDNYPDISNVSFEFLFLQHEKSPVIKFDLLSPEIYRGFEVYLASIYKRLRDFSYQDATANYSKHNGNEFLCGKEGKKTITINKMKVETDEDHWICPYKLPRKYELNGKQGYYRGCPAFYPAAYRNGV